MIKSLTSIRFLAALWVFLFHLKIWDIFPNFGLFNKLVGLGACGMTLFFFLSGYILCVSAHNQNPAADYGRYATKRFARIYPLYLATLVLMWTLNGFSQDGFCFVSMKSWATLFSDITLTGAWHPVLFKGGYIRDGTWSLSAEAFFYFIFPALLLLLRHFTTSSLVIVVVLCSMTSFLIPVVPHMLGASNGMYYSMPIFRLSEFVAGISAALIVHQSKPDLNRRLAAAAIFCATVYLIVIPTRLPYLAHAAFLIPFLCITIGHLHTCASPIGESILKSRFMVFLGEASYSLYLTQCVTIFWFVKANPNCQADVGGPWGLVFITIAISVALHLLVEKPARRYILNATLKS